jgi:hypothetical protein
MSKRKKGLKAAPPADADSAPKPVAHPPTRRPVLLGISIVLFVAWLAFLVFVAWAA